MIRAATRADAEAISCIYNERTADRVASSEAESRLAREALEYEQPGLVAQSHKVSSRNGVVESKPSGVTKDAIVAQSH